MNKNDLIGTIIGIVVGALLFGYLMTMGCDMMENDNQRLHEEKMKQYELMERTP